MACLYKLQDLGLQCQTSLRGFGQIYLVLVYFHIMAKLVSNCFFAIWLKSWLKKWYHLLCKTARPKSFLNPKLFFCFVQNWTFFTFFSPFLFQSKFLLIRYSKIQNTLILWLLIPCGSIIYILYRKLRQSHTHTQTDILYTGCPKKNVFA